MTARIKRLIAGMPGIDAALRRALAQYRVARIRRRCYRADIAADRAHVGWHRNDTRYWTLSAELIFYHHKLEKGLCLPSGARALFGDRPARRTLTLLRRWREAGHATDGPVYQSSLGVLRAWRDHIAAQPDLPAAFGDILPRIDAALELQTPDSITLHATPIPAQDVVQGGAQGVVQGATAPDARQDAIVPGADIGVTKDGAQQRVTSGMVQDGASGGAQGSASDVVSGATPDAVPAGTARGAAPERIAPGPVDALAILARARRSTRDFTPMPVDPGLVTRAVQIAQLSPSACNRQPWKLHLYDRPDDIARLLALQNGNRGFGQNVPLLAVLCCDLGGFFDATERVEPALDGGLFLMSLLLALQAQGLASCCLNWCVPPDIDRKGHAAGNIPANEKILTFLAIGHPAPGAVVPLSARRPLSDVIVSH